MSDTIVSFTLGVIGFLVYEAHRIYSFHIDKKETRYDAKTIVCVLILSVGAGLLAVFLVEGNRKASFFVGLSSLTLLQTFFRTQSSRKRRNQLRKYLDSGSGAPIDDVVGQETRLAQPESTLQRYFGHTTD